MIISNRNIKQVIPFPAHISSYIIAQIGFDVTQLLQ